MQVLLILVFWVFSIFGGHRTDKAEVYLENGKQLVGFRATGVKGKVEFNHLDAGSYRVSIVFPQQDGKYMKDKPKYRSLSKASYNPRKKTYYYQGNEGYFAIHFSGISNVKSENFVAVFKEEKDEENTYQVLVEFGAHRNNAGISIRIETLTPARFKKAVEKTATNDISILSIPNIR